jgi:heme-degrading monooxygenase HmoA
MNLIVRVLKGRVQVGQVAVFREQARKALDGARQSEGLVYAQVGRQAHSDGGEEIVFVSVWRDLEALYGWVGGTDLLETPVLSSGSLDVFDRFEVQHYETYEPVEAAATEARVPRVATVVPALEAGGRDA